VTLGDCSNGSCKYVFVITRINDIFKYITIKIIILKFLIIFNKCSFYSIFNHINAALVSIRDIEKNLTNHKLFFLLL